MHGIIKIIAAILLVTIIVTVQQDQRRAVPAANTSSLYEEIKEKQKGYEFPPENARIDKVWKKIPGLNGRKVNLEKSYENMKKSNTFDEKKLVYDQVEPEVKLEDLPAAPIYKGNEQKNMVTFLINVSWGAEYIPSMLETLDKHQVKANFFIDGAFARDNPSHVQMIEEKNHLIGSHGFGHPDFYTLRESSAKENLVKTNELLASFSDEPIRWFGPPSGSFSNETVTAAESLDMLTILWTVDTIDWKKPTREVLLERVQNNVHNGATILMHPTKVTSESLDPLITQLKKNYQIVTLDVLMSEKR
ncbi:polysaccharide deacetylase family protein [Halobacillus sp. Marseille-Q1614]|uniref:polysaccharide deacetylase family protein n=1 Tax=Halobacillus sp. Marseille-Q1614 TaxID=2709134 RepID=UPI00156FDD66|nr:polysaccharide deacetylase family protein [Halobacillus sp. Marseille-Q1614]